MHLLAAAAVRHSSDPSHKLLKSARVFRDGITEPEYANGSGSGLILCSWGLNGALQSHIVSNHRLRVHGSGVHLQIHYCRRL